MSDIYVGIREDTEDREVESDLRQHVCPQCGNVDILTGDEEMDKDIKPILAGDKLDECCSYYRCAGGLGEFRYRYLPNKCTACGARFTAVKKEKTKLNKEAVGWLVVFAFVVAAHIALSMFLIAHGWPAVAAFCGITAILLIVYGNILTKIDDNTYDKDPGPEYICEHGLSDAAFRRIEKEYEEEAEEETEEEPEDDVACDTIKQVELELLKQRLQTQQNYILQAADPSSIVTVYADDMPAARVPLPIIRPWDIHPW